MTELMSRPASQGLDPERRFTVRARLDGPLHVIEMSGELDVVSRTVAIDECASIDHRDVLVDLSGLTFMDCAGYGALVTARTSLERRGGSLVLTSPAGQPQRLIALIEQLELAR
ncbi:MAG TPA: STAS domain-containing protein [Acidimicrobiales bacterium]|nr:STAS domain-containing protein [Acidimicrobiales bacterium]